MSKRKKPTNASVPSEHASPGNESVTTRVSVPLEILEQAKGGNPHEEATAIAARPTAEEVAAAGAALAEDDEPPPSSASPPPSSGPRSESVEVAVDSDRFDAEMTVNLVGELHLPGRDDLDAPTVASSGEALKEVDRIVLQRKHLRGLVEALVFAADSPIKPADLAKLAHAPQKLVKELLTELQQDYATRGMHLDEVAGGWCFRTSPQYAPFVRDLTKQKPVRLTRAQVETLAIIAYRQPITRPEIDDVRGVDTGPVLKLLLERDLVRILGKRDEPGRPLIYGTTGNFLEFFGLKSLKDLPTLREFTELSDESRDVFEDELGETPDLRAGDGESAGQSEGAGANESAGEYDPGISENVEGLDGLGEEELEALAELERLENGGDEDEDEDEPHPADDDGPTLAAESPPTELPEHDD